MMRGGDLEGSYIGLIMAVFTAYECRPLSQLTILLQMRLCFCVIQCPSCH